MSRRFVTMIDYFITLQTNGKKRRMKKGKADVRTTNRRLRCLKIFRLLSACNKLYLRVYNSNDRKTEGVTEQQKQFRLPRKHKTFISTLTCL